MIDGHIRVDDWGQTGSLEPQFTDDCTTRQNFGDAVKFLAARTRKRYPGVDETRALMLTREYLFDVCTAQDDQQHSYVWLVHTFGTAAPDRADQWRPSGQLSDQVKELSDVRTLQAAGRDWGVTVRQTPPREPPPHSPLDADWWSRPVGVRIRMLGQPGMHAHVAATPKPSADGRGNKEPAIVDGVTVAASQESPSAVFAALHEPFEDAPLVDAFQRIAQTDDALAVRVSGRSGGGFDDRLLLRVGQQADEILTLAGDGESFTFAGFAFVRRSGQTIVVQGHLHAMTFKVPDGGAKLVVNGVPIPARLEDGILQWSRD
jgi:hypothetical protein